MIPAVRDELVDVSGFVYGVHLRGHLPSGFRAYLRERSGNGAELESSLDVSFRVARSLPDVSPIWKAEPGPRESGQFTLFREPAGFGLTADHEGRGLFRVTASTIAVEWLAGTAGAARCFFSYALPLWLEYRGVPVLHASAASWGDRAVAFVGQTGIGKSTLCAGLVRSGYRLVADDALPLREDDRGDWRCAHGPPWIKLWPSALEGQFGIAAEELPRVEASLEKRILPCVEEEPGETPTQPKLASVYLLGGLTKDPGEVSISPCTARESLVRLIEHSLAGAPAAALGWSAQRLSRLSRIAMRIPVKHLRYPGGDDPWPLVRQAIADDLSALHGPSIHRR